jgi:hypothetical protein
MSGPSRISRREAIIAALEVTPFAITGADKASLRDGIDVAAEKMNAYPQKPLLTVSVTLPSGQSMQLKATQLRVTYNHVQRLLVDRSGLVEMPPIPRKVVPHEQPST